MLGRFQARYGVLRRPILFLPPPYLHMSLLRFVPLAVFTAGVFSLCGTLNSQDTVEAKSGIVPLAGKMSPHDWVKPFVPAAPQPKIVKHGDAWPVLPDGEETPPVKTPETVAPPLVGNMGPQALLPVLKSNRTVSFSGQSRSTVSEPATSQWGNTVLFTHNWDAAVSSNGGTTWTRRDPRRFATIDGGFCCDQYTVHVPVSGKQVTLWLLQYGYSSTTRKNVQRIAVYRSESELQNGTVRYWNFAPANFGYSATHWLDFPHMSYGNNYAYATTNVFRRNSNGTNTFAGSVCWRMSLTNLKTATGSLPFQYIKRTSGAATWRLAQGIKNTAYWWQLETTSRGRLYWWPENSNSISSKTIGVSSFTYITTAVSRDKSGRNFMGRASTRPLAGWVGKGVIGFGWNCMNRSGRPQPYTRFVRISESSKNKIGDYDVWNSSGCWSYPAVGVNARGDLGGVISYGQSDRYPGVCAWISDPTDTGLVANARYFATGAGGPSRNAWGDYMTVAPHPKLRNSWIGTGMAMNSTAGGNTNQIPRYVHFGRSGDVVTKPDLTVTALTSTTTSLRPLSAVTLRATVKNQGLASNTTAAYVGYYLSTNSIISTGDTFLGNLRMVAQSTNVSRVYSRTVTIPGNATPGVCYLGAYADYTARNAEELEGNNTRALRATCLTPYADLQVSGFQASPTTFKRGQRVSVQAIVRNAGNKASPACSSGYYLSTDAIITTSDRLLGVFTTPALNPNSSSTSSVASVVIPTNSPLGRCYLGAYADRLNRVVESSNRNNYRSLSVVCQDGTPDLWISALTASGTASGGGTIVVRSTTANRGTGIAPASTTGIFLSTNSTISVGDTLLAVYGVASLNPNTSSTRSTSYLVPRCYTSRTGYIGAFADVTTSVTELSETNNTRATTAVTITPYAGSGRYVEWRARVGTAALSAYGAASFRLVSGPRSANMCVVAPRNVGDWHLLLWSATPSPGISIDALTNMSLGLINGPLLPGFLQRVPASGRTYPTTNMPNVSGIGLLRIYTHSAWFDAGLTTFKGFGSNSAAALVRS